MPLLNNNKPESLLGYTVSAPNNPGEWIGKTWRKRISSILTCLLNPKFSQRVDDGTGIITTIDSEVRMGPTGYTVIFPAISQTRPGSSNGGGGYMGDYSNTSSYTTGQTVRVKTATTISGVSVAAGYYGVPPGITVPPSGTGNQIPQYPEPTSGTVYWHLIVQYC
jgi:hypothetical protein